MDRSEGSFSEGDWEMGCGWLDGLAGVSNRAVEGDMAVLRKAPRG